MTGERKIRVLIVDDHPVVREGLRAILEVRQGFEVAGEAGDGETAVERSRDLRPDVAIVDLRLPGLSGIEVTASIRRLDPNARILALTSAGGDADVRAALAAGAAGFLFKDALGREVVEAIIRLHEGHRAIAPAAMEELLSANDLPSLTPRETQILELMAAGLRNQEIGAKAGMAVSTVKTHVNQILEKLGAQDRTEAVTTGLKRGLIHLRQRGAS